MFTVAQLKVLKDNYAKGVFRVREADLTLDFANGADMERRIKAIEADLVDQGLLPSTTIKKTLRVAKAGFCR